MMIAFQPIIKANKTTNNTRVYGYFFMRYKAYENGWQANAPLPGMDSFLITKLFKMNLR